MVRPSMSMWSTSPITTASIGQLLGLGGQPGAGTLADEHHNRRCPQPNASTVTNVRPVGHQASPRVLLVELDKARRPAACGRSCEATFWSRPRRSPSPGRRTSSSRLPEGRWGCGKVIASKTWSMYPLRPEASRSRDWRATTISSFVGTVQTCDPRGLGGRDLALGRWPPWELAASGPARCRTSLRLRQDAGADPAGILADAAGEHDRVGPAQGHQVRRRGSPGPSRCRRRWPARASPGRRRSSAAVSMSRRSLPAPPIPEQAGMRLARGPVEDLIQVDAPVSFMIAGQGEHVEVADAVVLRQARSAGTCRCEQATDLPWSDRAQRRAAAEVARDDLRCRVPPEQLGRPPGDVAVARAVEAPAADAVQNGPLVGDGVALALLGDRPVEAGLEGGDQRHRRGSGPVQAPHGPRRRAGCGRGRTSLYASIAFEDASRRRAWTPERPLGVDGLEADRGDLGGVLDADDGRKTRRAAPGRAGPPPRGRRPCSDAALPGCHRPAEGDPRRLGADPLDGPAGEQGLVLVGEVVEPVFEARCCRGWRRGSSTSAAPPRNAATILSSRAGG